MAVPISKVVWQCVPGQRDKNREGPMAEHRKTITLYIKLVTVGRSQVLSTGNVGQWLAEVDQI